MLRRLLRRVGLLHQRELARPDHDGQRAAQRAFKRLAAIHVRNDLKRVFVDGDEVCVIYNFVTDTPAGPLATIEWLRFDGDRIRSIDLYYDQLPWQTVMAAMAERTARPAAQPTA